VVFQSIGFWLETNRQTKQGSENPDQLIALDSTALGFSIFGRKNDAEVFVEYDKPSIEGAILENRSQVVRFDGF